MTIATAALRKAIEAIKPVAKKTSLNITEYVRLRYPPSSANIDGGLILNAFDNTVEVECNVEADLPEMDVCVPAQRLLAVVANAGEEIDLKLTKAGLAASSGRGRYRLPVTEGNFMPAIDTGAQPIAEGYYLGWRDEMAFCQFAAMKHEAGKPWAGGVHALCRGGKLEATGCNGSSLFAHARRDVVSEDFEIIVPIPAMQLALMDYEKFAVVGRVLMLYSNERIAKIKLIDAQYPSMKRIVSHERAGGFSVDSAAFLGALEAVAPFKSGFPACRLKVEPDRVTVTVESAQDSAEESVPAEGAASAEFWMNLEHMVAITRQINGDKAQFYWGEGFPQPGGSPLLVKEGDRIMGSSLYRR